MSYEPGRVPWQEDVQLRGVRHRLTWWGERTSDPIVLLHGLSGLWRHLAIPGGSAARLVDLGRSGLARLRRQ